MSWTRRNSELGHTKLHLWSYHPAAPMTFQPLSFDAETHLADVHMFGQRAFGAVYLIDDARKAIIETGTSWDAERILEAVHAFGLRPHQIDAVVVSHIHLDHAGGAGFLLDSMTAAKVYVHERGYKHLVDPTRLVTSARQALGPTEAEIFGTMKPIPADRLVSDRKSTRLNSSHVAISYAVFCLKKKTISNRV